MRLSGKSVNHSHTQHQLENGLVRSSLDVDMLFVFIKIEPGREMNSGSNIWKYDKRLMA